MAKITFHASSRWKGEGVGVDVAIRQHRLNIDEPKELHGKDEGPNPVELLLASLGSCLSVLAALFAPSFGVELKGFRVETEGDLDPAGFQGQAADRPGFLEIRYRFEVDSPSESKKVLALLDQIQRVCPVKDTLRGIPVKGPKVAPLQGFA
jgi:uncharacterized OsmC-like protein